MKKIAIIGGSGFVGTNLIDILGLDNVLNFDLNKSEKYSDITQYCDIRDINTINLSKDIETVILLAAVHSDDILDSGLYYDTNCKGTSNVLLKMNHFGIKRIIFLSSVAIYGLDCNNPNENYKPNPFNHYGKSKLIAEEILSNWYKECITERSLIIIRPTVIFGEKNRGNVFNLINQISKNRFLMIGKGTNKKSIAYVKNVSCFIKTVLNNYDIKYEVYNYSDKPDFDIYRLVDLIYLNLNKKRKTFYLPFIIALNIGKIFDLIHFITKKKIPISSIRIKKFCANTIYDSNKALSFFKPPYTIEEGLKNTIDFDFK